MNEIKFPLYTTKQNWIRFEKTYKINEISTGINANIKIPVKK